MLSLMQGNSLDLLGSVGEETVDLVFADPPYFLSTGGSTCSGGKRVSVDKGEWDKSEDSFTFNKSWLTSCRSVLKRDGSIFVSGTSHNIYQIGYIMQTILGMVIINDIQWNKVNPPPNLGCRCFTHTTETILWAKKDKKARHTFNYEVMKHMNGGKQMKSLWDITPPKADEKVHGTYPCMKPRELLTRVILAASNEGDLVLDPFMGSGTTGVVAHRLKRNFIGMDSNPDAISLTKKRLGLNG